MDVLIFEIRLSCVKYGLQVYFDAVIVIHLTCITCFSAERITGVFRAVVEIGILTLPLEPVAFD